MSIVRSDSSNRRTYNKMITLAPIETGVNKQTAMAVGSANNYSPQTEDAIDRALGFESSKGFIDRLFQKNLSNLVIAIGTSSLVEDEEFEDDDEEDEEDEDDFEDDEFDDEEDEEDEEFESLHDLLRSERIDRYASLLRIRERKAISIFD